MRSPATNKEHIMFTTTTFFRSCIFLALMTLLTGAYTGLVTLAGTAAFPYQAGGSIFTAGGKQYSALLGQPFSGAGHLWGRPMIVDTSSYTHNGQPAMYAGPSNKTPAAEEFGRTIAERAATVRAAHPENGGAPVPVDLVTMSGSGLDPHISPAAAEYQVARLARATGFTPDEVRATIAMYTEGRFLGLFGEPRVHVLKVNLALDGLLPNARADH